MSEPSALNMDDHWRRLAEELGLEAPPSSKPAAVKAPTPELREEPASEEPAKGRRRRGKQADELQIEPTPEPIEEPVRRKPKPIEEPVVETPAIEEPESRSRSRRGRGGRRPSAAEEAIVVPPEVEVVDVLDDEIEDTPLEPTEHQKTEAVEPAVPGEAEPERGRRRRRSRRKKPGERGERPEAQNDELSADSKPTPVAADLEDDSPMDNFADWSVPSWDELIASLHRS